MELKVLNKDRGIYAIYQGGSENAYIIYSTYYGVVAVSSKVERNEDYSKVDIYFDICRWNGYWSLRDIINRGVKKMERQFKEDKVVNIKYNIVNDCMESIANLGISIDRKY